MNTWRELLIPASCMLLLAPIGCGDDAVASSQASTSDTQGDGDGDGDLYADCDGTTFYPVGCEQGECIDPGLEQQVYDIWRDRFMTVHNLTDAQMDARIEISDVTIADGPTYVFWRIDYVFVLGWVRSRQNESANLGDYPLMGDPSAMQIEMAVNIGIEDAEQFDLPAVLPYEDIVAAFESCEPGITIDWCHIDFVNVSGILDAPGGAMLDSTTCRLASVDLASADVLQCIDTPCEMP